MSSITIITGGIGSGKSVVTQLLAVMGYPVYDCDSRAKWLMNNDGRLVAELSRLLGADIYDAQGILRRDLVAKRIFGDSRLLSCVNAIVHPAVRTDILEWACRHQSRVFVETALLDQSGLRTMAGEVWLVDAPVEVRVERVMKRNGLSRRDVEQRIQSQNIPGYCSHMIVNDGTVPVMPQVLKLLGAL